MHLEKSLVLVLCLPAGSWEAARVRAGRPKAFRLCCRADTKKFLPWQGRGEAPRAALQCKALEGLEWTPLQAAKLRTHPWEGRLPAKATRISSSRAGSITRLCSGKNSSKPELLVVRRGNPAVRQD